MFVKKQPADGRRVPTQERARQRVERILDAAADVFASEGVEAAAMEAIAERAETSIGSIYQFFPNKLALFEELARRYHEKVKAFFDGLLESTVTERPIDDIVEAAVEALWVFHDSQPAFRAVWLGLTFTPQVLEEGEAINKEFARRIEALLGNKLVGLPPKRRPVTATVVVEILSAMLIVSARRDAAQGTAIKEETKLLLRRYLAPYAVRSGR